MKENSYKEPLQILIFTLAILLIFSFSRTYLRLENFGLKSIDLVSDLRKKAPRKKVKFSTNNPIKDSITEKRKVSKSIPGFEPIVEFKDKTGTGGVTQFIQALVQLKKKKSGKVRIGYFGDSMIEGDLITQDIRQKLQDYFGGDGVGFVPITSVVAGFRQTIHSEFSDNWADDHFLLRKVGKLLPPSGHSFYAEPNAWASFVAFPQKHLSSFHEISLFYGPADSIHAIRYLNKEKELSGTNALNKLVLAKDTSLKKIKLEFNSGRTPLYGLSFESETGVFLDNYSFRGICGTELMKVNSALFKSYNELHALDLIVLHYGPNLLYKPEQTDFSYYKKQMGKTIKYLQSVFPKASILIVSSADKAYLNNGIYETAPGVEPLVLVQEELAKENHCAFWNLYLAMGGENSMTRFAEDKPVLAHRDYTHFNLSGSHWVARRLHAAMMEKYNEANP